MRYPAATNDTLAASSLVYGADTVYYSDDLPLVTGSILYKAPHTLLLALNVNFVIDEFTYTTDSVYGRVTKAYTYTNQYPYGIYWSGDQPLVVNTSALYTGQHNNVLAPISDFEYGNYRIVTNEFGIVTTYSYIDHPYPQGPYWCDNASLFDAVVDNETGYATIVPRVLYTGQHTNTLASNITPFEVFFAGNDLYVSQETGTLLFPTADGGSGYMIGTDSSGVVSRSYINHIYEFLDMYTQPMFWADSDLPDLVPGDLVYTGKHTNIPTPAGSYSIFIFNPSMGRYDEYAVVVGANGTILTLTPPTP